MPHQHRYIPTTNKLKRKGVAIMAAVIRQCTSDDAGLIRSLGMTTFRDTFAADNSRENMDDYLRHSFSPRTGQVATV